MGLSACIPAIGHSSDANPLQFYSTIRKLLVHCWWCEILRSSGMCRGVGFLHNLFSSWCSSRSKTLLLRLGETARMSSKQWPPQPLSQHWLSRGWESIIVNLWMSGTRTKRYVPWGQLSRDVVILASIHDLWKIHSIEYQFRVPAASVWKIHWVTRIALP